MKATQLLRMQHQDVEQLFDRLESAVTSERAGRRDDLAATLVAHSAIELQLFYPACLEVDGFDEEIREALEEHAIAEWTLQRLLAAHLGDPSFLAKVVVLRDIVKRHVDDEEDEILPEAERAFDDARLEDLGATMAQRFQEVRSSWEHALAAVLGVRGSSLRTSKPAAAKRASRTAPAKRTRSAPAKRRAPSAKTARKARGGARPSAPPKRKRAAKPSRKRARATSR